MTNYGQAASILSARKSTQCSQTYIRSQRFGPHGPFWGPLGPRGKSYILHTSENIPMALKEVSCESSRSFWHNRQKPEFYLFWSYSGPTKDREYGPWRPVFWTPLKVVPMKLKSKIRVNFLQKKEKHQFWPILALFEVKRLKVDNILNNSKSSSNELKKKQVSCASSGKL